MDVFRTRTRVGGGGGRRDRTHLDVVVHDRGVTPAVTARAVPPSGAPTRSGSAHHAGGGKVCFRGGEEKRGRVFFLDACTAAVGVLYRSRLDLGHNSLLLFPVLWAFWSRGQTLPRVINIPITVARVRTGAAPRRSGAREVRFDPARDATEHARPRTEPQRPAALPRASDVRASRAT